MKKISVQVAKCYYKTKKNSLLVIASICIIGSMSFKFAYDAKRATAEVEQMQGIYIFTDSKPVMEYEYLGTVKVSFALSGQYQDIRDKLIKKAKNDFPNADGLIMQFKSGGSDKCDAIKFK